MSENPDYSIECLVVGAGVIGLAIARELAAAGREVLIAERARQFGSEISARNSEVIHAGIYYECGSLKARACIAGARRLYRYCGDRHIPHRRCGKLIVAAGAEQVSALEQLELNARQCGVTTLRLLTGPQARALEPALRCAAALHSPDTGIIDSHAYMLSLLTDAERDGAVIAYGAAVHTAAAARSGFEVTFSGETRAGIHCRWLINAAGLDCVRVAQSIDVLPRSHIPTLRYAKGSYFALAGSAPFGRLIYPVPEPGGLGVHMTVDLANQARFGPDVEWVDEVDYQVDPRRGSQFYAAIRRYWPELEDGRLQPGYAGVRPKLSGPGEPAADFLLAGPRQHGIAGLVNLFGIESPGLTASLDIAERVRWMVEGAG